MAGHDVFEGLANRKNFFLTGISMDVAVASLHPLMDRPGSSRVRRDAAVHSYGSTTVSI